MCPMQWLTPRSGFPQSCATVRATRATVTNGAPIPGPGREEEQQQKIWHLSFVVDISNVSGQVFQNKMYISQSMFLFFTADILTCHNRKSYWKSEWNSAIMYFIIHICAVTGLLWKRPTASLFVTDPGTIKNFMNLILVESFSVLWMLFQGLFYLDKKGKQLRLITLNWFGCGYCQILPACNLFQNDHHLKNQCHILQYTVYTACLLTSRAKLNFQIQP